MKKKFWIPGGILLLILIGVGIGLSMYYKPHKDYAHSSADITVSSADLCAEYCSSEAEANQKYTTDKKTILVSGKVKEIAKNQDGTRSVVLEANEPSCSVNCTLTAAESPKAEKLQAGATVNIKGECTGMQELIDKQVIMIRCGIADEK